MISAELPDLNLTFNGEAVRVLLSKRPCSALADLYAASGWPARAKGLQLEADYSAPTAGPPPWTSGP